ncbi:hypothetical protein [Thalassotalea sp. ND16A]|uniref:hypothetical protein n=1 Tax=Thalassotalea sp. ND16A TaxID=1535422 RepID=UPI000519F635|nr:hypothetical protein [Thalassotalea sp. ND16A]KGJ88044.1 hypothetical protein ND16A_2597 [Thalassotalea sp. ND16A]
MNKHTKLALMVAPVLAIGGYIASDFWVEEQANATRIFQMTPENSCDVLTGNCVLLAEDFKLNIFDDNGKTTINSTFPLDTATLFLVDKNDQATSYQLQMSDSPYYWYRQTPLRATISQVGDTHKMRIIATIKGGQYISEFYTQTGSKG